jgi:hypothetical protein
VDVVERVAHVADDKRQARRRLDKLHAAALRAIPVPVTASRIAARIGG